MLRLFRKSVEKIQVTLKSDKIKVCFTWRRFTFMAISRWFLIGMRNISNKSCRENRNTHFTLSDLFLKIVRLWQWGTWWSQRGHILRHNMAHTRSMLDKQGYTHACTHTHARSHTHGQYVIFIAFFAATIVRRTRLSVTLKVHCLSCVFLLNVKVSHLRKYKFWNFI
jgi:hypothetical protein